MTGGATLVGKLNNANVLKKTTMHANVSNCVQFFHVKRANKLYGVGVSTNDYEDTPLPSSSSYLLMILPVAT